MRRWFAAQFLSVVICLCLGAGLTTCAYAQAAQPQLTQQPANAGHHGTFSVELLKPLDSKKLKEGDPVEAKLTGGITLPSGAQVPGGTKIVGHVTQATTRAKGEQESSLGISFDKLVRAGGEETPVKGVIQAVAPNPNADVSSANNGVDYGVTMRSVMAPPAASGGKSSAPVLNDDSTGVIGFKNMKLTDGVITSTAKELKLDAGTRFMLNVTIH